MKVVKRAIDATALAAADKHLMVRVLHDRKQMRVWGDSVRLAHVFVNLLGNAIKCTPARGAILINFAVSLNAVEVTVTDTGAGMAKDALDSLFNPLAQAKEVQGGGHVDERREAVVDDGQAAVYGEAGDFHRFGEAAHAG